VSVRLLADEHVPSVFVMTLRSNGYEVSEVRDAPGEGTDDRRLLQYCGENGYVLVTHDKKDFAGDLADAVDHAGVIVYTDANAVRDDPEGAVGALDRVLAHYPAEGLANELVWLDRWRR
jgi:predicted nuclease of predicted toxin-antitoxin system